MKKVVLFAVTVLCLCCVSSCTDTNNVVNDVISSEYCWKFTTTTKCTGVSSSTVTVEKCNLTERQAEEIRKSLEGKASSGGITCTITATKKKVNK